MPTTECISDQAIRDHITRAIKEVFSTMLGQHAQLVEPPPAGGGEEASPPLFAKQSQHAALCRRDRRLHRRCEWPDCVYLPEEVASL